MRVRSRWRSLGALGMLLIGCASAAPDAKQAPLGEPQIQITQISNIAEVARHVSGAISVQQVQAGG